MVSWRHLGIDFGDVAVRVDQVGDTLGVTGLSVFRRAVFQPDFSIYVADQQKRECELVDERLVVFDTVEAGAENDCVCFFELEDSITESFALDRSTRGVCFGVPPKQNVFSAVIA